MNVPDRKTVYRKMMSTTIVAIATISALICLLGSKKSSIYSLVGRNMFDQEEHIRQRKLLKINTVDGMKIRHYWQGSGPMHKNEVTERKDVTNPRKRHEKNDNKNNEKDEDASEVSGSGDEKNDEVGESEGKISGSGDKTNDDEENGSQDKEEGVEDTGGKNSENSENEKSDGGRLDKRYDVAHKESFAFFNDIPNRSWKLMKERAKSMPTNQNPDNPLQYSGNPEKWYQINWEPNFSCLYDRRIGGFGEEGRWVCNPHRIAELNEKRVKNGGDGCLVYSLGNYGNLDFEEALQEEIGVNTCEIHIFDTTDYWGKLPKNIYFHAWGIGPHDDDSKLPNLKSFQDTVKELGHENRIIDILKVDCEGCEWRIYQDWFKSKVHISQLLVETHFVPDNANDFFQTLRNEDYVIYHKEPKSWSGGGTQQEYSFLKLHPYFYK